MILVEGLLIEDHWQHHYEECERALPGYPLRCPHAQAHKRDLKVIFACVVAVAALYGAIVAAAWALTQAA